MAKSKTQLNKELREAITKQIFDTLSPLYEDLGYEKDNVISFPTLDEDRNEKSIVITISVPTGSRDDNSEHDCYEAHENYATIKAEKEAKAKKEAKLKAEKIKLDNERRAKAKAKAEAREAKEKGG